MGEQVLDEDRLPSRRGIREILRYAVIERELSLLHQHHDCGGDELLAHRAGLKDGLSFYWDAEFYISPTIALGEQDAASAVDANCQTRNPLASHFVGNKRVDGLESVRIKGWHKAC